MCVCVRGCLQWDFFGGDRGAREALLEGYVWMQELQAARMHEASQRLGRPVTEQVTGLSPPIPTSFTTVTRTPQCRGRRW